MARNFAANGMKNYLYSFDGKVEAPIIASLADRSFHSVDIPYVFGNDYILGKVPADGKALATSVQNYWTNFAKTGDPNGGTEVTWPEYTAAGDQSLTLATTVKAGAGLKKELCDFWDGVPVPFP